MEVGVLLSQMGDTDAPPQATVVYLGYIQTRAEVLLMLRENPGLHEHMARALPEK